MFTLFRKFAFGVHGIQWSRKQRGEGGLNYIDKQKKNPKIHKIPNPGWGEG